MRKLPIQCDYTEEELLKMSKTKATINLTEKQVKFCEFYIEGHNRKTALIKAGYSPGSYDINYAYRLLKKPEIKTYICWLKVRVMQEAMINAIDVIDEWIRIAFSDMTDFVNIKPHSISLKPAEEVDGQLIKAIKSGRDGISIELHDKMKALDNLAKYMEDMPKEWKQKLEERKTQLLEQEFEFKKQMADLDSDSENQDDGFMEAIKNSAKSIWEQ